jgi:uncharacterized protein YjhX (UPF0386 family)
VKPDDLTELSSSIAGNDYKVNNYRQYLVLIIMAVALFMLAGCMSQEEQAIQGKWANGNAHYWAEWNFSGGSYSYYFDNGFTNIAENGRYNIVEKGDEYIDLELFNRKGLITEMLDDRVQMRIKLQKDGSIRIQGGEYYLVNESSLSAVETAVATAGK